MSVGSVWVLSLYVRVVGDVLVLPLEGMIVLRIFACLLGSCFAFLS